MERIICLLRREVNEKANLCLGMKRDGTIHCTEGGGQEVCQGQFDKEYFVMALMGWVIH
jgi:hypothetical protein